MGDNPTIIFFGNGDEVPAICWVAGGRQEVVSQGFWRA